MRLIIVSIFILGFASMSFADAPRPKGGKGAVNAAKNRHVTSTGGGNSVVHQVLSKGTSSLGAVNKAKNRKVQVN